MTQWTPAVRAELNRYLDQVRDAEAAVGYVEWMLEFRKGAEALHRPGHGLSSGMIRRVARTRCSRSPARHTGCLSGHHEPDHHAVVREPDGAYDGQDIFKASMPCPLEGVETQTIPRILAALCLEHEHRPGIDPHPQACARLKMGRTVASAHPATVAEGGGGTGGSRTVLRHAATDSAARSAGVACQGLGYRPSDPFRPLNSAATSQPCSATPVGGGVCWLGRRSPNRHDLGKPPRPGSGG